jgi:ribosome biogenesis GTPase
MAVVEIEGGARRMCHLQLGGKRRIVVGDRVALRDVTSEIPVAFERMPRRTELRRPAADGRLKVVAANVDRLAVVSAVEPPFREGLIDRYVVAAEAAGMEPILVLNKTDLPGADDARARLIAYRELGYVVHAVSAKTGAGLAELAASLAGRAAALVGHSGVGKSALLNALLPGTDLAVGDLSAATGRGRHVTSVTTLHRLPGGGFLLDSPGIRSFGLFGIEAARVRTYFREFAAPAAKCGYDDCLHRDEPDCAVRAAAESGAIRAVRYESYLRLLASVESGEWE